MADDRRGHIRHGVGAVRPYVYGHLNLIDLVKHAFGGEELERVESGKEGAHIEVRIGDSVVVLETGVSFPVETTPSSIYVYVEDVDAAYRRAIEAGATSLAEPEDKPYKERGAGVKDSFGNTWWIATYVGPRG